MPAILKRITPPIFAQRDFVITDFGAVDQLDRDSTQAISKAIAACSEAGGGRVVVPKGRFHSGPIHLKSNVNLHLAEGSEIVFSDRFEEYLPPVLVRVGGIECYNYSPLVYARDCKNVAVTGKGRLNGNPHKWWAWAKKETRDHFKAGAAGTPVEERVFATPEAAIRPSFLSLMNCTNVLLEDFTIGSGPNWTIHPIYCENITIRRVNVDTEDGPNNDGIDPDSCRDLLIEDCYLNAGDDCIVLKSGYNEDGWRVNKPTENVVIRRCRSARGHGGVVIGSEMSAGVRNVFVHDCQFDGTDRGIRIKSRIDRGGVVENIHVRDISVKGLIHEAVMINMDYGADRNAPLKANPPVFRNMSLERIKGKGSKVAIRIQGTEGAVIENLRFHNLDLETEEGALISHARHLLFDKVAIHSPKDPLFKFSNVSGIRLRNCPVPGGRDLFQAGDSPPEAVKVE